MKVTELRNYPIKGARGISHKILGIKERGPEGDRRWLIVDEENYFITQRTFPALAKVVLEQVDDGLNVILPDEAPVNVTFPDGETRVNAMVWDDIVFAAVADGAINETLSRFLGKSVKLVHMDARAKRALEPDFVGAGKQVSFADAYPLLITSTKSLDALNSHIEKSDSNAVPMERFRPNIVVDGEIPWDEDSWAVVKIGDMVFDAVKPCDRCVVTTQDQMTGDGSTDNQPIRALTQLRRSGDARVRGVLFGWNLVPRGEGHVSIGDGVEILERRVERWRIAN